MPEEFPQSDSTDAGNRLKNRVKKAVGLGAVVAAISAGEGCMPEQPEHGAFETARASEKRSVEFFSGAARGTHDELLRLYYHMVNSGQLPGGRKPDSEILARALDIILKKGIHVQPGEKISVKAVNLVPVEITVGKTAVSLVKSDYTERELLHVHQGKRIYTVSAPLTLFEKGESEAGR